MNQISLDRYVGITSHIDEFTISILENAQTEFEWIQFNNMKPNVHDLKILNEYFKKHPKVYLRLVEIEWLKYLPDLQMITFFIFIPEDIELIKDRKITGLKFEHESDKKNDFSTLLYFKETLEELHFEGNYKNIEETIKQLGKLRKLSMSSVSLNDLSFLENLKIEDFYYYGSKVKDWSYLVKITTMKKFRLKANTNLKNFDFITHWKELEELNLLYCSKLVFFPNCEHLKNLKTIFIIGCNRLSDIDELKKLKNIRIHANGKMIPNKFYNSAI